MRLRATMAAAAAVAVGLTAGAPPADAYLYFRTPTGITRANADGTGIPTSKFVTANNFDGMAIDDAYIYWDTQTSIGRANLDGTGMPNPSFIPGLKFSDAMAVDGGHIYWTDGGTGYIGRANLDGTGIQPDFIPTANTSNGVAVDGHHVYWTNYGGSIGRANLDGTGVDQNFIPLPATSLIAVAVDGSHIYWTEGGHIARADLDGSNAKPAFISDPQGAASITLDGGHIYWVNDGDGSVGKANLDGSGVVQTLYAGAQRGIAVDGLPAGTVAAAPSSLSFPAQPLGTFSAPEAVRVTQGKFGLLGFGRPVIAGAPDDFLISSNTCGTAWIGQTCTIGIRFGPTAPGDRSATLQVPSDDPSAPLTVPLAGTGGALPAGPSGSAGAKGNTGPPGKIELVSCRTVTKVVVRRVVRHHRHVRVRTRRHVRRCTTTLVTKPVSFTTPG